MAPTIQHPEQTARQSVSEWLRSQLDGRDEIILSTLVYDAYSHFDDETLIQLGRESLRKTIIEQGRRTLASTRRPYRPKALRFAALDPNSQDTAKLWSNFMEWTGRSHVRLMAMTHEQLLAAASIRLARGQREAVYAVLWNDLATALSPGQKVGDVFSPQEVAQKALGVRVTIAGEVLNWEDTVTEIVDESLS